MSMEITISQKSGEKHNHPTIELAIIFFARRLLTKKQIKKIHKIKVSLVKSYENLGEFSDYINDNGMYVISLKIDREIEFTELISTIAHEMIHAAQTVDGRFTSNAEDEWIWCGKSFGNVDYTKMTAEEQYKNLPWETEAHDGETSLAKAFFNYYYSVIY